MLQILRVRELQQNWMNFNYKNYVKRYKYEPFQWPPDIGLAQLHARCSEPGPNNYEGGVQCPCCERFSKKKITQWWKQNIDQYSQGNGGAIPGYFHLLKYYILGIFLAIFINSIYLNYAIQYACSHYDKDQNTCLNVAIFTYIEFTTLIQTLNKNNEISMSDNLLILQTVVFYFFLLANTVSVFYLIFLHSQQQNEEQENFAYSKYSLLFYNVPEDLADKFPYMLKNQNDEDIVVKNVIKVYRLKDYYHSYLERNKTYYHLLSKYVSSEQPTKSKKLNKNLMIENEVVRKSHLQIGEYSGKLIIVCDSPLMTLYLKQKYHLPLYLKWWYGFRTILHTLGLFRFDPETIPTSATYVPKPALAKWQNIGEDLGNKMAIKIKTFFVAIAFIIVSYLILYYPMLLLLKFNTKQTVSDVKLTLFEKIVPTLISLLVVTMSIGFRIYMQKVSAERNPKNQLQKAKFVLLTTVIFHIIFYVILPTAFFALSNGINQTVKLYVIAEQVRTFIIVQLLIVGFDIPYRMWKGKKIQCLSDQRFAFRYNQQLLNKTVETRDYPLEIRLQAMFRMWSFALFYCFYVPYIMYYLLIAMFIIFWIEKRNLFKHYVIQRKVSVYLEAEFLSFFINFFCIFQCFVYCLSCESDTKIYIAVSLTLLVLVVNALYWLFLRKKDQKRAEDEDKSLVKGEEAEQEAKQYQTCYKKFIENIQNDALECQVENYLEQLKVETIVREKRKSSVIQIEMSESERSSSC